VSGGDPYDVLDAVFTALSPPLVLEVVVRFAGELRRRRSVRVLAWAFFGGLALASLGALFRSRSRPAATARRGSPSSSRATCALVFEVIVLGRCLRGATDPRERSRARLVLLRACERRHVLDERCAAERGPAGAVPRDRGAASPRDEGEPTLRSHCAASSRTPAPSTAALTWPARGGRRRIVASTRRSDRLPVRVVRMDGVRVDRPCAMVYPFLTSFVNDR